MKNLYVLLTDKPSKLANKDSNNKLELSEKNTFFVNGFGFTPQNIYITNDEEIKEGDWFLDDNNSIGQSYKLSHIQFANPKKIILTTDFDKQPRVQAIDDEFLEWFVKNPSCEEVEVNHQHIDELGIGEEWAFHPKNNDYYKIIIPKLEPKQERSYSEEDMIEASKYGYNFHKTTQFPQQEFEDSCIRNTQQWFEQFKNK